MKELFKIVKRIAAANGKSNLQADLTIKEKLASGEQFDIKYLFDLYDLDINAIDKDGNTALISAIAPSDISSEIEKLITAGSNINIKNNYGNTALGWAAENGHVGVVTALILASADLNVKDKKQQTALHLAADKGRAYVVKALIDARANLNVKDKDEQTALHLAAANGHVDVVTALILASADLNVKDKYGFTALHLAAVNGRANVVTALIDAGVSVHVQDTAGRTALHMAACYDHADVVKLLIDAGVSVHVQDTEGQTALFWAAANGHVDVVKALIDAGVSVNVQDRLFQQTALHRAAVNGRAYVVKTLIDAGVSVHIQDRNGETALRLAAGHGYVDVVKALIDAKADIATKNKQGKTALESALERSRCMSAAILLKHSSPEIQKNFKNNCIANKQDNIIYKNIISSNFSKPDYVGAYKILEVLFKTREEQINFLGQIDISPDHEFISLLKLADKYKAIPTVVYSCFDKFKDIEKTEEIISKKPELTRQMGEVSYREVASLAKILSTAKAIEVATYLPVEILIKIASHDITYDQKLADSIKKSREDQPVQGNSL